MAVTTKKDWSGIEAALIKSAGPRARLYAILDTARAPDGLLQIEQAGMACESLLSGETGEKMGQVAPYLIEFHVRSPFSQWWFQQWGRSVGVLVQAKMGLAELRTHFRTLLIVQGPELAKYFFRFYDPRVLPGFLSSCGFEEATRFFGPAQTFYCEDQSGDVLLALRPCDGGVSVADIAVGQPKMSDNAQTR